MKNSFMRTCSLVLVLVLLINMLPMSILAEEYKSTLATAPEQIKEDVTLSDAQIVEEIIDKRTEYSKEFLLSNGLHIAAVYADAVHYKKDGGWQEIDNTLTAKTNGTYTNTAGVWNVSFPQTLTDAKTVTIEKDGHTLSFSMAGELRASDEIMSTRAALSAEQFAVRNMQLSSATVEKADTSKIREQYKYAEMAPEKLRSRLTYANVYQNTDIIYDLDSNRVKESIVIDAYNRALRGYRYTLNVGDMVPELGENGQILFYDTNHQVVMAMPAPFLMDAANAYNDDIQVQLTGNGSTYTLTYLLPQQWLAETDRVWPVILDPVVTADLTAVNIRDRTVASQKTYGQEWSMNSCGYGTTAGIMRTYLKYDNLPALTSSDIVVSASISMYQADVPETVTPVEVRKVNGTWDSETITWTNKPAYADAVEDYAIVDSNAWYHWIITDIVRDWYANKNTGMMFKATNAIETGGTRNFKQFLSSDYGNITTRPMLMIAFRNNNGLESYWDYTTSSAGRAGTGYINNFTGNMTWIHNDIGFDGNRMPVSINHIYNLNDAFATSDSNNSNDTAGNSFGLGVGWRTNYNQLIYKWNVDSDYYIWEDADGTDHYFKYDSTLGKYKDEDGLELTLTDTGSGTTKYCITDKTGNCSYFDTHGRLSKLSNNQQTKSNINITYNSTSRLITCITDGAGRKYLYMYENGLLDRIEYMGSGSKVVSYVEYSYTNENSKYYLETTKYKDEKVCTYDYNELGLLLSAQDIDGYKLTYTYNAPTEAWQPYRVLSVEESNGSALTFAYAHNQTTIADYYGNVEIHQFNDFGNTISIQDNEGHATYTQYARNTDDDSGKKNQLTLSSKLQNTVVNLLKDSSFETGNTWSTTVSVATVTRTNTQSYVGSYGLKIDTTGQGLAGAHSLAFNLEPGKTVTFSAYVKADVSYLLKLQCKGDNNTYYNYHSETFAPDSTWMRRQLSYTNESNQTQMMWAFLVTNEAGTLYMDCAQLELAETASRYNLIENGDFRHGEYGWTRDTSLTATEKQTTLQESAAPQLDNAVYQIQGNPTCAKHLYQTVKVSGNAGDTYVLAGWAKGDSVPYGESEDRQFALAAFFFNTDNSVTKRVLRFNPDADSDNNWQYLSGVAIADKPYNYISIGCQYDYNANTAWFDGIQLYKEEFGSSYTYDDKGNVKSVTDLQKQTTTYEYDTSNNLTKVIQNNQAKMTYTYDSWHNVKTATTQEGLVYNFTYDGWGNNTSVSITRDGNTMTSTATYSADGNRLVSTTDALGKVTTYGYNANTNILEWVQYPEDTADTRTEYTYDAMYRLASAACETDTGNALSAAYTYTDDYLTKIQTPSTTYNFTYGDFGLRTGVSVGTRTLATYNYTEEAVNDRKYDLDSLDYGNGDSVEYEYDDKGRVTKETYEDGDTVTYAYDNNGALAKVTDSATGITTSYYYDLTNRMMKYLESGTNYSHSVGYEYDTRNNLTKLVERINGTDHTTTYTYDSDNRLTQESNTTTTRYYTYDNYGRKSQQALWLNGTAIQFDKYTFSTSAANTLTNQISSVNTVYGGYNFTYTYTYDDNGNITSISDGTNTTSYAYDSANQLIRENNQAANYTYTWVYDNAGNILNRKEYAYTTGTLGTPTDTVTYTYGDSQWGDLLTAYDGTAITSDAIGNMLSDGTWTYTWQHGRQLASMTSGTTTWDYTYNADGLRTKRTNGTATYSYTYNGSQLTQMTVGSNTLYFTYDASGTPLTVEYNGVLYYYITNLQGDVVTIISTGRAQVVHYTYDAWGNLLSTTGAMASTLGMLNPLRYRGYVYDEETGLYYVSSRYYDPEIGRWINADDAEILLEDYEAMLQYNLFAYCWNNPVNMYDPDGYWTLALAGGGYLATAGTLGASNIWNPVGWIILGAVVVTTVVVVATNVYNSEKTSSSNEADPYARPGQKKQGRERKNKARKSKDWKPRSNPKPPKKHTPGRDHRRYK